MCGKHEDWGFGPGFPFGGPGGFRGFAGMWGGVRGALPPIQPQMIAYCRAAPLSRTADQAFLRERIWPTVRQSVLVHDSEFSLRDSMPFPTEHVPPEPRVGQAVAKPVIRWPEA